MSAWWNHLEKVSSPFEFFRSVSCNSQLIFMSFSPVRGSDMQMRIVRRISAFVWTTRCSASQGGPHQTCKQTNIQIFFPGPNKYICFENNFKFNIEWDISLITLYLQTCKKWLLGTPLCLLHRYICHWRQRADDAIKDLNKVDHIPCQFHNNPGKGCLLLQGKF